MAHPGFNVVCCCTGERVAGGLSMRIQQLDVRCETKTKDNVFVDVVVSVQYQVSGGGLVVASCQLPGVS